MHRIHYLVCESSKQEIASLGMNQALGLACTAGCVEKEQHVFAVHGNWLTVCILLHHLLQESHSSPHSGSYRLPELFHRPPSLSLPHRPPIPTTSSFLCISSPLLCLNSLALQNWQTLSFIRADLLSKRQLFLHSYFSAQRKGLPEILLSTDCFQN